MKKIILILFVLVALSINSFAQQTIVVKKSGIFTDLAEAATALVTLPIEVASGIVVGTCEGVKSIANGSTTVVVNAPPVIPAVPAPAPVVIAPPPAPVVVTRPPVVSVPGTTVVTTGVVPQTTVITTYGDGTTTSITRRASVYETGAVQVVPVLPEHRVGSSPHVNPYVFRYR